MSATQTISILRFKLINKDINLDFDEVAELRRIEMQLHRWAERECNGEVERDEETGKVFRVIQKSSGSNYRYNVPDMETGALKRLKDVCESAGLHYFHQTDPRGCAVYVSTEPMTASNYSTTGAAIC
tara:strand:+ start:325 stop:705 length:381 start_codon:yes stop_codon:yes gene_type:complete